RVARGVRGGTRGAVPRRPPRGADVLPGASAPLRHRAPAARVRATRPAQPPGGACVSGVNVLFFDGCLFFRVRFSPESRLGRRGSAVAAAAAPLPPRTVPPVLLRRLDSPL